MSLREQSVEEVVKSSGLKMTPQRRAIVEYLETAKTLPTADEILQAVNRQFPMTSRATVYNTLNWLKEVGLIKEIAVDGQLRFDPDTAAHHYFICKRCGNVEKIPWDWLGDISFDQRFDKHNVESYEIIFRGECLTCRA